MIKSNIVMYLIIFVLINKSFSKSASISESWFSFAVEMKGAISNCTTSKHDLSPTWECLKNRTLRLFDVMMASNVIPLTGSIRLVQRNPHPGFHGGEWDMNRGDFLKYDSDENMKKTDHHVKIESSTWPEHVLERIAQTMETHVIQIDTKIGNSWDSPKIKSKSILTGQQQIRSSFKSTADSARHRRRNQMLPVMVFGVTALGMVLVPIGFQFLAVLGGKALLLAKMALLLASINGLKRIATSGVHYGLYHVPEHSQGYYDRGDGLQLNQSIL